MLGPARIYFIIFGVLTIAGGVFGFIHKGSVPSIVAGSIAGILLLIAAFLLPANVVFGLALAAFVSIALAGQFVPKFIKTSSFMPAGMMSILSVIGLVVALLAWVKR